MTRIRVTPIPTETVRAYRAGGADAYGARPERAVSDGVGTPCRHCLCDVPAGAGMLVLAHRPFPALQPYAETGPIFLCAEACEPWSAPGLPPILGTSPDYLIRGYGTDDRIAYGSGSIVAREDLEARAAEILANPAIAYVHVRSARNNCFQCRIERA